MTRTVADWIIDFLGKQGVEFVFSHPGGPVLPLYDSMRRTTEPVNVLVRHEGAGSFMADAYAKVTGRVGVCMSTMGPGAANMTVGVGAALSDSSPIVAITGQLASSSLGRGYQQETDHNSLFRPLTKCTVQLSNSGNACEVFERTFRTAISGRPGPVHVDVPVDVSASSLEEEREVVTPERLRYGPAPKGLIKEAHTLLSKARTPAILAGGGVILADASVEVTRLAESLGAPVATSFNGRGAVPEDHPLAIGRAGEYTPSYCRRLLEASDVIVAIGYRFTDVSVEGWKMRDDARIIQIDVDPDEVGLNAEIAVALIGDARETIQALLQEIDRSGAPRRRSRWVREVEEARVNWRRAYSAYADSDAVPVKPQRVMKELTRVMGRNSILTSGAGRAKMWAASVLPIYRPRTWIHSGGYACMGYEVCAAIASKLAKPEARVFSVGGDGSFQMHAQELATAVEYAAPFVAVVLNDVSLASIRNAQLKRYGEAFGTEFKLDVNLSDVARAFGASGERITRPSELAPSLGAALNEDRPVVLDVMIDPTETPKFD